MKRVGIQGFFTRKDLIELVEIFVQKGVRYAALTFASPAVELCDASLLIKHVNPAASVLWLNTSPFINDVRPNSPYEIDVSGAGAFSISFQLCEVEYGAICETALGTTSPVAGEQLKIWDSGLRLWKKRIVRDVHIYSHVMQQAYLNEKMNVSKDAIAGYERGDWRLVSPSGQNPALIIHPLIARKEIPLLFKL
jgi:hypothetical protein